MSEIAAGKTWWVYMIETHSGRLYTGISTDVERRFAEHCGGGRLAARFFRTDAPLRVAYREPALDRTAASRREAVIKKLKRVEKLVLIGEPRRDA